MMHSRLHKGIKVALRTVDEGSHTPGMLFACSRSTSYHPLVPERIQTCAKLAPDGPFWLKVGSTIVLCCRTRVENQKVEKCDYGLTLVLRGLNACGVNYSSLLQD
jgi:hypothetical protein